MRKGEEHLQKLRELANRMKVPQGESSDLLIGDQIVEFGELIVTMTETLDTTQRRILWLTWVIVIGTVAILITAFIK